MNKRTIEKKYKNRFRRVFAQVISSWMDVKIKPSRVRLSVYEEEQDGYFWMVGKAYGVSMKIRTYPSKEADDGADAPI